MAPTNPRFAGKPPHYPEKGECVRVLEGEHADQVVEVVGQGGSAFAVARHVVVRTPGGELVWYWPWNLGPPE
jgi:hypothetical protein